MLVLSSHPDDGLIAMCGLLCSSWIQMNRGTSRRSMVNPGGDTSQRSVVYSNKLTARPAHACATLHPLISPNLL